MLEDELARDITRRMDSWNRGREVVIGHDEAAGIGLDSRGGGVDPIGIGHPAGGKKHPLRGVAHLAALRRGENGGEAGAVVGQVLQRVAEPDGGVLGEFVAEHLGDFPVFPRKQGVSPTKISVSTPMAEKKAPSSQPMSRRR